MFKRLYQVFIMIAMIHLFALVGMVVYLVATGRLNTDRVGQIAGVLRGEYDPAEEVASTRPAGETPPVPSEEELQRLAQRRELARLVSDRRIRTLEDRSELGQQIQLQASRLVEEARERDEVFSELSQVAKTKQEQAGLERQVAVLSKTDPKQARELLMNHTDAALAVRLLMEMDDRSVQKIVGACKTAEEIAWAGEMLNRMGQRTAPDEAADKTDDRRRSRR